MDILFIFLILNVDDKFGITIYEEQNPSLPPCSRLLIDLPTIVIRRLRRKENWFFFKHSNKNSINNIAKWMEAFQIFVAVYSEKSPHKSLRTYAQTIQKFDNTCCTVLWWKVQKMEMKWFSCLSLLWFKKKLSCTKKLLLWASTSNYKTRSSSPFVVRQAQVPFEWLKYCDLRQVYVYMKSDLQLEKNSFRILFQEKDVNLFSKKTKTKAVRQNRQPWVVSIYILLVGD